MLTVFTKHVWVKSVDETVMLKADIILWVNVNTEIRMDDFMT